MAMANSLVARALRGLRNYTRNAQTTRRRYSRWAAPLSARTPAAGLAGARPIPASAPSWNAPRVLGGARSFFGWGAKGGDGDGDDGDKPGKKKDGEPQRRVVDVDG